MNWKIQMYNFKKISNFFYNPVLKFKTKKWKPFSRLITKADNSPWVLNEIQKEMVMLFNNLNIKCYPENYIDGSSRQSIFYFNKYDVLSHWKNLDHRIAFPYYHGDPRSNTKFNEFFKVIKKNHRRIHRIQVSHSEMENLILNTGIDSNKVFKIPISINMENFQKNTPTLRRQSRKELGVSNDTILIGSFQKDGNLWGDGNEAKLIKGPDIFIKTVYELKKKYEKISVLLTGPSRGYVKNELKKIQVPFIHRYINSYKDIAKYYYPLDAYLISSREEGGPRSVLETMACSIPLISTKVGQAIDLVDSGKNGWLVNSFNPTELAETIVNVIENQYILNQEFINLSRKTAQENSYPKQINLWKLFMKDFLDHDFK
tara:strand:+ start:973 stop:2091 length:1119 start_codon:yes stop_codon:yes gene_type:complete